MIISGSERGAVLLYVIGLVALLGSVLALASLERQGDARWLSNRLIAADARYMSYAPLAFARYGLESDIVRSVTDGAGDVWWRFREAQAFPVDGGEITMRLNDFGRLPNVNGLDTGTKRDGPYRAVMQRYLSTQGLPTSLVDGLKDWVDADSTVTGSNGAERGYYGGRQPAVWAPNRQISSYGEMMLVHGARTKNAVPMRQVLSYGDRHTPININTASPSFLRAIFAGQPHTLDAALGKRRQTAYPALGPFYKDAGVAEPPESVQLAIYSTYFDLEGSVTYHGTKRSFDALFERKDGQVKLIHFSWK